MDSTPNSKPDQLVPRVIAPESAPNIFAEGISQVLMGFPNTKVLLHTVVEPGSTERPEVRRAVGWLVMPTATWLEVAQLIINQAVQVRDQMNGIVDTQSQTLKHGLANLSPQTGFARERGEPAE